MSNIPPSVIVVGVDGTSAGQAALEFAMREASLRGSALEVVTTWEWDVPYDTAMREQRADTHTRAEHAQEAAISAALTTTSAPPVISRHVIEGDAAIALVGVARTADYLVVGTRKKNALERALLGSVSHYCVRHASCPVVVVPHTQPVAGQLPGARPEEQVGQPVR